MLITFRIFMHRKTHTQSSAIIVATTAPDAPMIGIRIVLKTILSKTPTVTEVMLRLSRRNGTRY